MNETLQFGLSMLALGMGGTVLTLVALAGIIRLVTLIFPPESATEAGDGEKENAP